MIRLNFPSTPSAFVVATYMTFVALVLGTGTSLARSGEDLRTLYVATNKTDSNTVMAFRTNSIGALDYIGEFRTGGRGTGDLEIPALTKDPTHPLANGDDPLISAYGIHATQDKKHLICVNAGDGTVSLMAINADGSLTSKDTVAATDPFPVSVATHGQHVVVASVGKDNENGSLGVYVIADGKLVAVDGSRYDLKARPSTVAFTSRGNHVVVNELVTGKNTRVLFLERHVVQLP